MYQYRGYFNNSYFI